MKTHSHIPILIIFCIVTLILVISATTARQSELAGTHATISLIASSLGGLIAVLSAILLLLRAAAGYPLKELAPLTLPLLAGILIVRFHWGVATVLGVLSIALFVREMIGTPEERRSSGRKPPKSAES